MWNPFKRKISVHNEERKSTLGLNDALGSLLKFGIGKAETPSSAFNLYNESSAVSIPINKVGDAFASIKPILRNGQDIITSHPLLELLQKPSPFYDGRLFLEVIGKHYLITNEVFIAALGNISLPPLELQPIGPDSVTTNEGPGGYPHLFTVSGNTLAGGYSLVQDNRGLRYLDGPLRELKHIRGFSTKNNSLLRGQSLLGPAAAEARQHILGNTHNVSLLEKGGRMSLVFHFEEDMDPDDFEQARSRVMDRYAGANNAGNIGVTAGGKMDLKELGTNNKDMDFAILQAAAKNAVALQYKVPLPLISNEAATFNNLGTSILALYDDAVLPLADAMFAGLGTFLLPRYGLDPKVWSLTYDILNITSLRERVLEEISKRKTINVESDNELRSLMAREPYEGGDDILKPANLIPVGSDLFTDDVPKPIKGDDE